MRDYEILCPSCKGRGTHPVAYGCVGEDALCSLCLGDGKVGKPTIDLLSETQEVLKLVEWVDHDPDPMPVYWTCPSCEYIQGGVSRPKSDSKLHSPTCQLSNLINKINSLLSAQNKG